MKSRILLILTIIFLLPALVFSQGRKTIKKKEIQSKTVYEYFIEEGIKDPVMESYEQYDSTGNVVELKEFNSEGGVKNWKKYRYDIDRNKVEEIILDPRGKMEERLEWAYREGLVVEKKYFDSKDRLVKRKTYKYEFMAN